MRLNVKISFGLVRRVVDIAEYVEAGKEEIDNGDISIKSWLQNQTSKMITTWRLNGS